MEKKINKLFKTASIPMIKPQIENYPVYVKETENMGKGVFASRDIKRNEICCWYDGVIIVNNKSSLMSETITGMDGYQQEINKDVSIAGFKTYFSDGGVAQLCNDYSTNYNDNDNEYKKMINVKKLSINPYNITYIASKNILKDEQLFVSYGSKYWESYEKNKNLRIEDRLKINIERLKEKGKKTDNLEKMLESYINEGDEVINYAYRHNFIINFNIEILKLLGKLEDDFDLDN